jgi:hypothetical protein
MKTSSRKPVLLIIDDEVMICEILADIIMTMTKKLNIVIATTVERAIQLIPDADMIISDIKMPNQHLLDQALKNVMSDKPIARMSGVTREKTNFMIEKPFKSEQVAETLQLLYAFYKDRETQEKSAA